MRQGPAALGELSGYLAGFSRMAVVEQMDIYARVPTVGQRYLMGAGRFLSCQRPESVFRSGRHLRQGLPKCHFELISFAFAWAGPVDKMTMFAQ